MRNSSQLIERNQRELSQSGIEERNGIFYRFVSEKERHRYRLLNDNELREEQNRCEDISYRILDLEKRKRSKNQIPTTSRVRPSSASQAPKLRPSLESPKVLRSSYYKPRANDDIDLSKSAAQANDSSKIKYDKMSNDLFASPYSSKDVDSATPLSAEELLQIKYQKNLEVIERLHIEKEEAKRKAQRLEREVLRLSSRSRAPSPGPTSKRQNPYDTEKKTKTMPLNNNYFSARRSNVGGSIDDVLYSTLPNPKTEMTEIEEGLEEIACRSPQYGGDEALNPSDLAEPVPDRYSNSLAPPQSSEEPDMNAMPADPSPLISGVDAASMDFSSRPAQARRRPLSASSALRRSRYHMGRHEAHAKHDEKKEKATKDLEQYELERKKRLDRASRASFSDSLKMSHEIAREKAKKKRAQQEEQEKAMKLLQEQEEELKRKRVEDIFQRSRRDTDFLALEAAKEKRMEVREKRKENLKATSAFPNKETFAKSVEKFVETLKVEREGRPRDPKPDLKTEDPVEVVDRLKRQRALWDAKLARQKEFSETQKHKTAVAPQVESMEQRKQRMEEKKRAALAARRKKQEEEEQRQKEEKRIRLERLISQPGIPPSINNTARLRAERVHAAIEKQREEEAKAETIKRKTLQRQSVTAKMTWYEMAQYDAERREKVKGNYVELFKIDQISAEKALRMKQESEERRKTNQDKIKAKLAERPSLITRQTQEYLAQAAKIAALTKVADATRNVSGTGKGGDVDDMIFTSEERTRIRAVDEFGADDD